MLFSDAFPPINTAAVAAKTLEKASRFRKS
jgi:hypothetical protein